MSVKFPTRCSWTQIIYVIFFTLLPDSGKKRFSSKFPIGHIWSGGTLSSKWLHLWFNESHSNLWSDLLSLSSEGSWGKASPWSEVQSQVVPLCPEDLAPYFWPCPGQPNPVRLRLQGRLKSYMVCLPSCLFFGWCWLIANVSPLGSLVLHWVTTLTPFKSATTELWFEGKSRRGFFFFFLGTLIPFYKLLKGCEQEFTWAKTKVLFVYSPHFPFPFQTIPLGVLFRG